MSYSLCFRGREIVNVSSSTRVEERWAEEEIDASKYVEYTCSHP